MSRSSDRKLRPDPGFSRRHFLTAGGAAALAAATGCAGNGPAPATTPEAAAPAPVPARINRYRTLGRTGFRVSDISMGCGMISDPNVVLYAYDHGMNLFDTAEAYGNGDSETKIGQALPHLDRDKIFIVTKLGIDERPDEQAIIERFNQSLARLKTGYADALYMHGIAYLDLVTYEPFHAACEKLKAEGKLRHAGISSHGPRGDEPDAMDTVLLAAIADGRFDVMLLSYGFVNKDEGERVLAACKEKNVGTTIMKSATGIIEMPVFDPENPNEQVQGWYDYLEEQGATHEEATERIRNYLERRRPEFEASLAQSKPFIERHGIKTQEELDLKSYQWVLRNPDAHTICPSMPTFEAIDRMLPLSGTELSMEGEALLGDYASAFRTRHCRFSCTECTGACPESLPVSTILRYAYYYQKQGRQKHAMRKYARLGGQNAAACLECHAPCNDACPHGVQVQDRLFEAHGLLSTV
jgi:predicted aldo/keto reductase-like oxidoreductase